MPTENRSSNTEMVSVRRDLLERLDLGKNTATALAALPELRAALALPAPQHQGEPVAVLYANGTVLTKADCGDVFDICCKVETPLYTHADPAEVERLKLEIEQLRLSLTLNDDASIQDDCVRTENRTLSAEVERLRAEVSKFRGYCVDLDSEKRELEHKMDAYKGQAEESATLRTQLAEAHARLRKVRDGLLQWHHRSAAEEIELIDAALFASAEPSEPVDCEASRLTG